MLPSSRAPPPGPSRAVSRASPIPRTVVLLGLVSLLTDVSSEMIVPLLPLLLVQVLGAGPAFVGLVDGAADAVASLGKLGSGILADRSPRQKPLVVGGYALSTFVRPLMGLAASPLQVLGIRVLDRVGKGLRTSPRDVLLAAAAPEAGRARAYGFHRAMDHLGAATGPLLAALLLGLGVPLRHVFLWSLVPGLLALAVLVAVREPSAPVHPEPLRPGAAGRLAPFLAVIALAALGTGADALLVVRFTELGGAASLVPILWLALHAVRAGLATAGGALADRAGRPAAVSLSLAAGAVAYAGIALAAEWWQVLGLAGVWGLRAALGDGAERALLVQLAGEGMRGRALGSYHLVSGVMALPAGAIFGLVYEVVSPAVAYGAGAVVLALSAVLLPVAVRRARPSGP